jgi:predicted DNA binding CopG/RHH family protein
MKKRIRYSDESVGPIEIVPDFLPSPAELAREDDGIKVTLSLSRSSVDFFKAEAQRQNCSYQRMIRRLVDSYAARYRGASRAGK